MESEEQQRSTDMKHVLSPYSQMHVDVRIAAAMSDPHELKQTGSSEEGQAPRVRKPYTITKQREKWTEEEHKKFLEALRLYGRTWRRIEEYIGSRTAVQIRSHAQKFFSKVFRGSGSNDIAGQALKAIEIPLPRPKRKSMHLYPRKVYNVSEKGTPLKQVEGSPLLIPTILERGNGSPTSVLSVGGSETLGLTFSDAQIESASPVGSAADSNDQDVGQTLNMTLPKVVDQCSTEAQQPTLKLFGKILVLNYPSKCCSTSAGNMAYHELTPPYDSFGNPCSISFDL